MKSSEIRTKGKRLYLRFAFATFGAMTLSDLIRRCLRHFGYLTLGESDVFDTLLTIGLLMLFGALLVRHRTNPAGDNLDFALPAMRESGGNGLRFNAVLGLGLVSAGFAELASRLWAAYGESDTSREPDLSRYLVYVAVFMLAMRMLWGVFLRDRSTD
jgi:hypothetical protein